MIHTFMQHAENCDAMRLLNVVKNMTEIGEAEQPFQQDPPVYSQRRVIRKFLNKFIESINISYSLFPTPLLTGKIRNSFEITLGFPGKFITRHFGGVFVVG